MAKKNNTYGLNGQIKAMYGQIKCVTVCGQIRAIYGQCGQMKALYSYYGQIKAIDGQISYIWPNKSYIVTVKT